MAEEKKECCGQCNSNSSAKKRIPHKATRIELFFVAMVLWLFAAFYFYSGSELSTMSDAFMILCGAILAFMGGLCGWVAVCADNEKSR